MNEDRAAESSASQPCRSDSPSTTAALDFESAIESISESNVHGSRVGHQRQRLDGCHRRHRAVLGGEKTIASGSSRLDHNVGANRNYNRVFRHSTADLFKWAAHDDLVEPGYLAAGVDVLERDPEIVLCHSQAKMIDRNGDPVLMLANGSVDGDGHVEGLPDPARFYELTADPDPAGPFRVRSSI